MPTIPELPNATSPLAPSVSMPVTQDGMTVEATIAQVAAAILANPSATGLLTVQALRLGGFLVAPQITADAHNYNPANLATASILRVYPDSKERQITGLSAVGSTTGRLLLVMNGGNEHSLRLMNENAASTAANRFALGEDRVLRAGEQIWLFYDDTWDRWREVFAHDPRLISTGGEISVATDAVDGPLVPIATKNFAVAMAAAL